MAEVREAQRELLDRVQDVLKAMRLFKSQPAPRPPTVPAGAISVLATIEHVASSDGCHSKELAAHCALDPSTISRAVAALVSAGLVQRAADPADGRASVLCATPRGREVLGEIFGWYEGRLSDALSGWNDEDLRLLAALLQRFSDDLLTRFNNPTLEAAR
jgi:DNA-binding MarR family transcriptional regulator